MKNNAIIMALVASLALGLGVTGTMLWMEKRAPKPVAAPSSAATSVAPPSIAGLSPAEAALTMGNYHYDLAQNQKDASQWPLAVAQYRVALAKGMDNPNVRTDLGNALRFSDQPEKALEQYEIAQKQDPRHEQSLFNQGGLWAQSLGNSARGIAAWKKYLKRFPNGQSVPKARQFIAQFGG